jgi:outer membrane protein W
MNVARAVLKRYAVFNGNHGGPMKKSVWLLIVLASGICAQAFAMTKAPDSTGKIEFSVGADGEISGDSNLDDNIFVAVAVNYGLNPNWSAGVSAGYASPGVDGGNGLGATIDAGEVSLVPVFGELYYRFPTDGIWTPYLELGLGGVFTSQHGNRDLTTNNLRADAESGFAVKLGVGCEWFLNENWAYYLNGGYVWTDADVRIINNANEAEVDTTDLDYWYAGGGIKYRFD